MTPYIKIAVFCIASLIAVSCRQETVKPFEYKSWVENSENGLKQSKGIDNCTIEIQYTPVEYLVLRDLFIQKRLSDTAFTAECKNQQGLIYFTWKIMHNSSQGDILYSDIFSGLNYQDLVQYFSFGIKSDLQVFHGDTPCPVPCTILSGLTV